MLKKNIQNVISLHYTIKTKSVFFNGLIEWIEVIFSLIGDVFVSNVFIFNK